MCFCLEKRASVFVIGWMGLMYSCLALLVPLSQRDVGHDRPYYIGIILGSSSLFVVSIVLLFAVINYKPNLLLPWLVITPLNLIPSVLFVWEGEAPFQEWKIKESFVETSLIIAYGLIAFISACMSYFWIIVLKYYQQLKSLLRKRSLRKGPIYVKNSPKKLDTFTIA